MKHLGFAIDNFGPSQLSYTFIRNANEFLGKRHDVAIIGFFENLQRHVTVPNFCTLNITEVYGYRANVVCTTVEQVYQIRDFPGPQLIYYMWYPPWLIHRGIEVEYYIEAFKDLEIHTRSKDYADLLQNCFGVKAKVHDLKIEEFLCQK